LFGESAGASSDDGQAHRHRFGNSDGDTFTHGREEEDIARGVELARVILSTENANVLADIEALDERFEFVSLVTVTEHDDYEIVVDSFEELFDDSRDKEGTFLRVETTDDGDDDRVRRKTKDGRLSGFALGGSRRDEVGSFDTELHDTDAGGVDPPVLHEPGLEVVRAGDGTGEVALVDDRVTRVTAGFPAVVSFVVEVLRGRKLSVREQRKETEGKNRTHVDEIDVRHLLDESRQHLVNKLRVRNDDLLDPSRPYKVLEVSREVVCAEEGGEDVDIVGELEDFGSELDSFGVLVESAEDGDAVASDGVELNHVESAFKKGRIKQG
jgi:hypothetical protein